MKKILILLFLLTNFLFASIGHITAIIGEVKIIRDSKEIFAKLGEKLEQKDIIESAKNSKAQITLDDHTIITIGQNSTFNIFEYIYDEKNTKKSKASLRFMKGTFKSITGIIGKLNKEKFTLRTKNATIGIRGTTIIGNQQIIICTDGAITVTANNIPVLVEKQEFTRIIQGKAPSLPETLTPKTLERIEQNLNTKSTESINDELVNNKDGSLGENNEEENIRGEKFENTIPTKEVLSETNDEITKDTIVKDTIVETINENLFPDFPDTFGSLILEDNFTTGYTFHSNEVIIDDYTQSNVTGSFVGLDLSYGQYPNNNYDSTLEVSYGSYIGNYNPDSTSYAAYWVSGTKTAQSIVQNIMGNTSLSSVNFSGTFGNATAVISGASRTYSVASYFDFNFGGGDNSFAGNITLSRTGTSETFQINVNNGTAYPTGFKSTNLTENGVGSGTLSGGYFGTGQIKAIGGSFNFTNADGTYTGVFVAPQN